MLRSSRRRFLQAAGLAPFAGSLALPGCGGDGDLLPPPSGPSPFRHGVASGDPRPEQVVLWTRATPPPGVRDLPVAWEVADAPDFARVVARGEALAEAAADHTVNVVARGLTPGRTWFYRFRAMGHASVTGRTRTAPVGRVARLRFAVVSCASMNHGWFHVYRHLAARRDLDAVLHLGDYLYEYPSGYYGNARPVEPAGALRTLAEYRARYEYYRRDPDLRELHRQHPVVAIWDDHEFANDSARTGADNHNDARKGPWEDRVRAAAQAWREWLPAERAPDGRIWRALTFGDLVELAMLDTRIWGRDRQAAPMSPTGLDPRRQLLGEDQERWLFERFTRTAARWKVMGQQVPVSPLRGGINGDQWDGYSAAQGRLLDLVRRMGLRDLAVLTGDRHASWALDVVPTFFDRGSYDPATGRGAMAVEFVTPGVTSPTLYASPEADRMLELRENPHARYVELSQRGYLVVDVTHERLQGAFFHVSGIERPDGGAERFAAALSAPSGTAHLTMDAAPAPPRDDAPPLAP